MKYSSQTVDGILSILSASFDSKFKVKTVNFAPDEDINEREVKVEIGTLTPFKGFRVGTCKMTAVKRMTAKPDFLKMSLEERNCEVELYEDCRTRKLLEECGCVPWEVQGVKVRSPY